MAVENTEQTLKLDVKEIRQSVARRPVLVVLQGNHLGMTVALTRDRTVVGRGTQSDIILKDDVASRRHAEIVRMAAQDGCYEYFLDDLKSTNGTYLNGVRVASQQLLQDGDRIKVGHHMMKFALLDEMEAEFQERLHKMTQTDELTGLRSRRSLFADLDRLITEAVRVGDEHPVAVLMLDVDFFKRVNDGYGHLVGSQTIRLVADIIREAIGTAERAARYGGEEYMAYVMGGREAGFEVAEEIRRRVEVYPFPATPTGAAETINITISIGVAAYPDDGQTALDLVQRADLALFRAKAGGRNRTCLYDGALDRPENARTTRDAAAIIHGPADAQ